MANIVEVRNLKLGEGIPKICVPLVVKTNEEIIEEAKFLKNVKFDLIEWRVDHYENVENLEKVKEIVKALREEVGINPKVICEGEDENGIYGLVSEGFGVAVVADIVNYDNFNIKKIKINNSGCDRCIYMAYKKNTYQVPAVKKFIKYINDTSKDIFINDK